MECRFLCIVAAQTCNTAWQWLIITLCEVLVARRLVAIRDGIIRIHQRYQVRLALLQLVFLGCFVAEGRLGVGGAELAAAGGSLVFLVD